MNGPRPICAGCEKPTTWQKPICDDCMRAAGEIPLTYCPLCECAELFTNSPLLKADRFGVHHTKAGGYAGKCTRHPVDSTGALPKWNSAMTILMTGGDRQLRSDYEDEPSCPDCGYQMDWADCHMIDCEDGQYDLGEEDCINYDRGTYATCEECNGRGGWWYCPNKDCPPNSADDTPLPTGE